MLIIEGIINMDKLPISVIIMTKNEEKNIAQCIDSVGEFAEIFVIDSGSTDRTCAIARQKGAQVVDFQWDGKYPKKKQWCLDNLPFSYEWVLYLDADEQMTPALVREIHAIFAQDRREIGYFMGYDIVFLGKVLRHGPVVYKLVLLKHKLGHFPYREDEFTAENMWEVEGHYQPIVDGPVARLKNHLIHHDHDDLFHYFDRHNRYSDWEAHKHILETRSVESSLGWRGKLKKLFSSINRGKWMIVFLYSIFFQLAFLDGYPGVQYAMARAFYYWQIELKTWELLRQQRQGE